jgi:hypothetical protein
MREELIVPLSPRDTARTGIADDPWNPRNAGYSPCTPPVLEKPGTNPWAARSCAPHLARMACHPTAGRAARGAQARGRPGGATAFSGRSLCFDSCAFRPEHLGSDRKAVELTLVNVATLAVPHNFVLDDPASGPRDPRGCGGGRDRRHSLHPCGAR